MTNHWSANRRVFLRVLSGGVASGSLAACSSGPATPDAVGQVEAGQASSFPVGSLEAIGTSPVALGHDEGGFYAMTLTCTHQGCNIAQGGLVTGTGIVCGCHGARFDANGHAIGGPARGDLVHFAVKIDSATGVVTIDGNTQVAASVRASA